MLGINQKWFPLTKKEKIFSLPFSPPQILALGFVAIILAGTFLLSLPQAAKTGQYTDFLTALFTATSAVCVTGLVVVDTSTYWSTFGQAVILFLIQTGGLGFMTMATLFFILMGRHIGLKERILIQESLNQLSIAGVVRLVRALLFFTFFTEVFFTCILALRWSFDYGWSYGWWLGLFHAVSAFNNAGFDLFGNFHSLTAYTTDTVVTFSITTLIILGGIGFVVVAEIFKSTRKKYFSVHTRLVFLITVLLIGFGMFFFALLEWNGVLAGFSWPGKLMASYFQAVTPRTAGFSTVKIDQLQVATLFFLIFLMFIGASPGSTGGGIKTTTFGLLVLSILSQVRGKEEVELFRRRLPAWQVYKALAILFLAATTIATVTLLLSITEKADFLALLFETTSAFGTVGLSTGITPHLSIAGRVLIILTMFTGRLGPLTLVFALAQRKQKINTKYPEEKIIIG